MFARRSAAEMRIYRTIMFAIKLFSDFLDIHARAKPCQFVGAFDRTWGAH